MTIPAPESVPVVPDQRGFTLVETLAGVMLTGSLLLGATQVFQSAVLKQRLAQETTANATLAAQRLETLVALPADAAALHPGTTTEVLPGNATRRTYVRANTPRAGAKTIKVTVWRGKSSRRVTLVAVRGR